jgi:hypothetical protein
MLYSGLPWCGELEIFLAAMAFFSTFTQFTHFIHRSNQLSHTVKLSGQIYPADNVVLVDTKGSQDSGCRDKSMVTLKRSPSTLATFDSTSSQKPHAIYDGGYENAKIQGVRLRIANGGAGQTGLIRAWADGFIQYMVSKGIAPFQVCPIHMYWDLID